MTKLQEDLQKVKLDIAPCGRQYFHLSQKLQEVRGDVKFS